MRGDEPEYLGGGKDNLKCSPRVRGRAPPALQQAAGRVVFPACAGMSPALDLQRAHTLSVPRVCGDASYTEVPMNVFLEILMLSRSTATARYG